jgi:membrane protein DedA with SNARE-associated domain
MDYSLVTTIALGIALSACCGFRVFIPMLAGALAGRFHLFTLPADMGWLASWPSIICFGTAAVAEVLAYYVPFIDNALDTIATPLSVAAGTVLATSILPLTDQEPLLRWGVGFLAGGASAGVIQLGTGLLRLFSSKATIGTGNVVVSSTENAAAIGGSVLSLLIPVVVAILILVLIIWIVKKGGKLLFRKRQER